MQSRQVVGYSIRIEVDGRGPSVGIGFAFVHGMSATATHQPSISKPLAQHVLAAAAERMGTQTLEDLTPAEHDGLVAAVAVRVGGSTADVRAVLLDAAGHKNEVARAATKALDAGADSAADLRFGAPEHSSTPMATRLRLMSNPFGRVLTALEDLYARRDLVPEGAGVKLGTRSSGETSSDVLYLHRDGFGIMKHDSFDNRTSSRSAVFERKGLKDLTKRIIRGKHWSHLDPKVIEGAGAQLEKQRFTTPRTHYDHGGRADQPLEIAVASRNADDPLLLFPLR